MRQQQFDSIEFDQYKLPLFQRFMLRMEPIVCPLLQDGEILRTTLLCFGQTQSEIRQIQMN